MLTKMSAIKLAFFFVTLFALLRAYHARHLHDGCIYRSFDRRTPTKRTEVIQMVTVYDGENLEGRPSPRRPPSNGETMYGGDNPKAPLFQPKVLAPLQGQTTVNYGGVNLEGRPSPKGPTPGGETTYGRDNPNAPPPPQLAPSRGQTTFGQDNPKSNRAKKRLADFLALLLPSNGDTVYGPSYLNAQPSPKGGGSEGETIYGRDNPKTPPSPEASLSGGQMLSDT